jgi:hypothetical protein
VKRAEHRIFENGVNNKKGSRVIQAAFFVINLNFLLSDLVQSQKREAGKLSLKP